MHNKQKSCVLYHNNVYNRFVNTELVSRDEVFKVLSDICQKITKKHLPQDLFLNIWYNIDHTDWEIQDDCFIEYAHAYEEIVSTKGAYKFKKTKKPVTRLKRLYKLELTR